MKDFLPNFGPNPLVDRFLPLFLGFLGFLVEIPFFVPDLGVDVAHFWDPKGVFEARVVPKNLSHAPFFVQTLCFLDLQSFLAQRGSLGHFRGHLGPNSPGGGGSKWPELGFFALCVIFCGPQTC